MTKRKKSAKAFCKAALGVAAMAADPDTGGGDSDGGSDAVWEDLAEFSPG